MLVTGSRAWPDPRAVRLALHGVVLEIRQDATKRGVTPRIVVVHGACPTGADAYADAWARWHSDCCDIEVETHRADWRKYGRAAGPIRNEHMVSLGAWRVLAFPFMQSRGTANCIQLADEAGLDVRIIPLGPP